MLLINPYANDLRINLQHPGNPELIAINDGVVSTFEQFGWGVVAGGRQSST
jgi:hypothetical protein